MTLLEFFFIISGIIMLILSIDIAKKQKFNALHFLIFIGVGGGLLSFTFFPNILNSIGRVFGVARGADVLVYASIIFLLYFVLLLLKKVIENRDTITSLVREHSLNNFEKNPNNFETIILIRAYNEEKVIKRVLDKILEANYKNILVVNDGSKDNTKNILQNYSDKIFVVNHMMNCGAGAALQTGFEYIKRFVNCKYIVTFDADGQHDIKDVDKFIKKLDSNKELGAVFGSRFITGSKTNIKTSRKITLFLGRIFTFFISSVNLSDPHNGLRAFRYETIKKINLTIENMAYASELIDQLNENDIKIGEVPVNIKYTKYSINKGQKSSNAINIAIRIIWSKFFR